MATLLSAWTVDAHSNIMVPILINLQLDSQFQPILCGRPSDAAPLLKPVTAWMGMPPGPAAGRLEPTVHPVLVGHAMDQNTQKASRQG